MTSSWSIRQVLLISLHTLFAVPTLASGGWTDKHEQGRCAIRGHCGKENFWDPDLPCPDNGLAEVPEDAIRQQLVGICGAKWVEGPVCCVAEQVITSLMHQQKHYAHGL
jgi:Niemann-Pick C1 protein